ncbi:MAG: hypothetical protein ACRD4B_04095 [Acidobacteriota bacterium]
MNDPENLNIEAIRFNAEQLLSKSKEVLQSAVAIVNPESPGADPLEVFAPATERRDDAEGLSLTDEQEQALRDDMAELGYGRLTDRKASDDRLKPGHEAAGEGGQGRKMKTQLLNALSDEDALPNAYIQCASPYRKITNQDEIDVTSRILGVEPGQFQTEYDVAELVLRTAEGFEPLDEPEVLPFGYDIQEGNAVSQVRTHQFVKIGSINGVDAVLMRIDRENYVDEEGKPKYRKQPDTAAVLGIIDDVLTMAGKESSVAFHTSSTYQASRQVDAVRAALQTGRQIGVATYGQESLAAVTGMEVPEPAHINQLPGELNKLAQQVQKLEQAVHPPEEE